MIPACAAMTRAEGFLKVTTINHAIKHSSRALIATKLQPMLLWISVAPHFLALQQSSEQYKDLHP